MDYRMQADDSADTANRRKTYIKQSGRGMRKSPKRFCLLTSVLIGDAPDNGRGRAMPLPITIGDEAVFGIIKPQKENERT